MVKPSRPDRRAEQSPAPNEGMSEAVGESVWEQVFERKNLLRALKRVEANGGAPGLDGMTVEALRPYLKAHWLELRAALDTGSYRPSPIRRVEIGKPDGGVRLLGIPTVVDRLIQQAMGQVVTLLFEPAFSPHSYGFRPGRRAHDAVEAAQGYIREGYTWIVDIDLEKFFDRVNHDKLMARVARVVKDKRVLPVLAGQGREADPAISAVRDDGEWRGDGRSDEPAGPTAGSAGLQAMTAPDSRGGLSCALASRAIQAG
jgi:RNA-directed DNA polymerase